MLQVHRWSKNSPDALATTCTDVSELEEILDELTFWKPDLLSASKREFKYDCAYCFSKFACQCYLSKHLRRNHRRIGSKKETICPHCLVICISKCELLRHIQTVHPSFG